MALKNGETVRRALEKIETGEIKKKNANGGYTAVKITDISARNRELVKKFCNECYSAGLADNRVLFYLDRIWAFFKAGWITKDLDRMDKDDFKEVVAKIEKSEYQENTKRAFKICLKKLLQISKGFDWKSKEYPGEIKFLSTANRGDSINVTAGDIFSEDDIKKLVAAAMNSRDRALIMTAFESTARPDELLGIKLGDVTFNKFDVSISLSGYKRKKATMIPLVLSKPLLATWIANHPHRGNNDAFLWTTIDKRNNGKPISNEYFNKMLKEVAGRAGIKRKRIYPYLLRHSGQTWLEKKGLHGEARNIYSGWAPGANTQKFYSHLTGEDVREKILKIHGKIPEEKTVELNTIHCSNCFYENDPSSEYCNRCRMPLSQKAMEEYKAKELAQQKQLLSLITKEVFEKMVDERVKQLMKEMK